MCVCVCVCARVHSHTHVLGECSRRGGGQQLAGAHVPGTVLEPMLSF